jgi:hypothetical protein
MAPVERSAGPAVKTGNPRPSPRGAGRAVGGTRAWAGNHGRRASSYSTLLLARAVIYARPQNVLLGRVRWADSLLGRVRWRTVCSDASVGRTVRQRPGPVFPQLARRWVELAFRWRRFSRPLGASFGSQRAARGRVDSLVTVVPANPIARRGVAPQDFLNDTRAGSTVRRLGLRHDARADFKGHSHPSSFVPAACTRLAVDLGDLAHDPILAPRTATHRGEERADRPGFALVPPQISVLARSAAVVRADLRGPRVSRRAVPIVERWRDPRGVDDRDWRAAHRRPEKAAISPGARPVAL